MPQLMRPKTKYWEQIESLFDSTFDKAQKQLGAEYKRAYNEILTKVRGIYYEIMEKTQKGTVLASDLYKYEKYYDLLNELEDKCQKLGMKESQILEKQLSSMYTRCAETVGKAFSIPSVNNSDVVKAINQIWARDGLSWSSRIWQDKNALVELLKNGLTDSIISGASSDELAKKLMVNLNVGYKNASRIARTELAHTQTKAAVDKYKEAGISTYKILPVKDEKLCDICSELATKEFSVDEVVIPNKTHPNCRCCTIAIIGD